MDRQIDRLTRLINDLLDVSRIHAGQLDVHAELVDLSVVVGESVEHFRIVSPLDKYGIHRHREHRG
jgi:signal transduction histidine kinase